VANSFVIQSNVGQGVPGRRRGRLTRWAPWLLAASFIVQLVGSAPEYGRQFVDLRVYVLGGAALTRPHTLYDVALPDAFSGPLPFTYPPFAAMLFYPLHWMPFVLVMLCWKAAVVAALYGVVRISQRMIGDGTRRTALLWTATGIWFEPIRSVLELGQVGVFLTLAVLYAAYSSRPWVSGLLVGIASGVKATPAITGLYWVGVRRWRALVLSALTFVATIGLSGLWFPRETRLYFTALLGDVRRVGHTGFVGNQSWNGALSRIVGHDVGREPLLFTAIGVTAALAVMAWWALGGGSRDALGSLLVVQLFALMACPISWTHHWVWVVPLMIWLFHGRWRDKPGAIALSRSWFVLMVIGVPTFLSLLALPPAQFSHPWYLAWSEAVYVPMTLITFGWIIATGFGSRTLEANAETTAPFS
jgi:alpha-1,2-mannosyltransferase